VLPAWCGKFKRRPGLVREELLLAKISNVRNHLQRVRSKLPDTEEAFLSDNDLRDIVVHNLWQALQGCIDIGSHVVADEGYGQPATFAEVFDLLIANQVLDRRLGERLRKATGLRNLIVHEYMQLDFTLIFKAARTDLRDLDDFLVIIVGRYHLGIDSEHDKNSDPYSPAG
jgi:uncharacterized protein YutE (UPF0331/DUF86 family)